MHSSMKKKQTFATIYSVEEKTELEFRIFDCVSLALFLSLVNLYKDRQVAFNFLFFSHYVTDCKLNRAGSLPLNF